MEGSTGAASSRHVNKSPGTWKARHFAGVILEGRPTVGTVDEIMNAAQGC
jgi:hypothetical protein